MVRPTMLMFMDERKSFHYIVENIIEKRIIYNYWVIETSYVFSLFVLNTIQNHFSTSP